MEEGEGTSCLLLSSVAGEARLFLAVCSRCSRSNCQNSVGGNNTCVTWHQSIREANRLPTSSLNTVTCNKAEGETVKSQSPVENKDLGMISQTCQLCILCKSWMEIIPSQWGACIMHGKKKNLEVFVIYKNCPVILWYRRGPFPLPYADCVTCYF